MNAFEMTKIIRLFLDFFLRWELQIRVFSLLKWFSNCPFEMKDVHRIKSFETHTGFQNNLFLFFHLNTIFLKWISFLDEATRSENSFSLHSLCFEYIKNFIYVLQRLFFEWILWFKVKKPQDYHPNTLLKNGKHNYVTEETITFYGEFITLL